MFAKMAFQLQLFSMPLILFSVLQFKPLLNVIDLHHSSLVLAALSSIGFLLSLGKNSKIRTFLLALCLLINFIVLINCLYLYPTLGVLSLILFIFTTLQFLKNLKIKIKLPQVTWTELLISYVILLLPLIFFPRSQVLNIDLFQFGFVISGLTFCVLNLTYLKIKSRLLLAMFLLSPISAFCLYYFNHIYILEWISLIFLILNTLLFGFTSFRNKSLKSVEKQYEVLFNKPELIIIGYFILLAMVGAFGLQMELSHSSNLTKHAFLDSLFTSMSAVCVTGLVIFDTPVDFSFVGQGVILMLIQLGGLGITTLSAWILLILSSGRLCYSHEDALHSMSGSSIKIDIRTFLKKIVTYFFLVEGTGAFLLFLGFLPYYKSWTMALWHAIFTSISAFCNAGFGLQSDNLISFNQNPFILFTVSVLIILGGFAPLMALGLHKNILKRRLNLQEKLALSTTGFLLLFGFFLFLSIEWSNTLADLNIVHKISNSWFQSVTTRTAGFNSVDLAETKSFTQIVMMILMFIGGNPGSTAGGVKTITVAVIFVAALNSLKENNKAEVFGRWIPYQTVFRAVLILSLSIVVHFIAYFFLSMTQHHIDPISLLFEIVSALATVGLSTGATLKLDEIGKLIIIFCMLIGRVGPLTFILLVLKQNLKQHWKTPEEDVVIT